jgi:hypothetical protein
MDEECQGVVEKIIEKGRHGPYAVVRTEELETVTLSLNQDAWQEKDRPEPGMYVILSDLRKKRAGWRALKGRYVKPSDEQNPEKRKEQEE